MKPNTQAGETNCGTSSNSAMQSSVFRPVLSRFFRKRLTRAQRKQSLKLRWLDYFSVSFFLCFKRQSPCNFRRILYNKGMKSAFSPHLKSMLREYDTNALTFHDSIVIERVLQFWEMKDYWELEKQIGKSAIINFFVNHRTMFDKKTVNFREKIFNIPPLSSPHPSIYEQINKPLLCRSIR